MGYVISAQKKDRVMTYSMLKTGRTNTIQSISTPLNAQTPLDINEIDEEVFSQGATIVKYMHRNQASRRDEMINFNLILMLIATDTPHAQADPSNKRTTSRLPATVIMKWPHGTHQRQTEDSIPQTTHHVLIWNAVVIHQQYMCGLQCFRLFNPDILCETNSFVTIERYVMHPVWKPLSDPRYQYMPGSIINYNDTGNLRQQRLELLIQSLEIGIVCDHNSNNLFMIHVDQ